VRQVGRAATSLQRLEKLKEKAGLAKVNVIGVSKKHEKQDEVWS